MKPPPREAFLFNADDGIPREVAARGLLGRLAGFCDPPLVFRGDAVGEVSVVEQGDSRVQLIFSSDLGDGGIEISIAADGWLLAEVSVGSAPPLRIWIEDPYEEKDGWPDGADGAGEAPLRISKRGSWLSIDCARFPGVPVGENGLFQLEDANH